MKETNNEFQIIFQGEKHEIDAKILAETIQNFDLLVRELNEELSPEIPINLKVKTFEEGSFEIFFALFADPSITNSLFSALTKESLAFGGTIISTLADLLSIKEFLGGNKPKSLETTKDNQTKIENNKGEIKVFNKKSGDIIVNNPIINLTINNTFNTLKSEKEITGLKMSAKDLTEDVEIKKEKFSEISSTDLSEDIILVSSDEIQEKRIVTKQNIPMNVFKIVFDEKYKWQFLDSNGQKISATIKDKDFFEKVKARAVNFSNGDILIVNMEISQEYNHFAKAYENKSYTITDIVEIRKQPTQTKLDM